MEDLIKNGTLKEVKDKPIESKITSIIFTIFKIISRLALIVGLWLFAMMGGFHELGMGYWGKILSKLFIIFVIISFIYGLYIIIFKKK